MSTSPASQIKFDFLEADPSLTPDSAGSTSRSARSRKSRADDSIVPLEVPEFGSNRRAAADASRMAGRINAANISKEEIESLLRQRQEILDLKFSNNMTRKDEIKLEYILWSLDRIEDARHGAVLDMLESGVSRYEQFMVDVQSLVDQLRKRQR